MKDFKIFIVNVERRKGGVQVHSRARVGEISLPMEVTNPQVLDIRDALTYAAQNHPEVLGNVAAGEMAIELRYTRCTSQDKHGNPGRDLTVAEFGQKDVYLRLEEV